MVDSSELREQLRATVPWTSAAQSRPCGAGRQARQKRRCHGERMPRVEKPAPTLDHLLNRGEFDMVPKASELPDHSLRSALLGSVVHGLSSFVVTQALQQHLTSEPA